MEDMHHYLQYFIYQTDHKSTAIEFYSDNKDQVKVQLKLQWMKSFRDVYRKFLHTNTH